MTKDSSGNEAKEYCSYCNAEIHKGFTHICVDKFMATDTVVDHDKEVPASERAGSAAYSLQMLCKQDKEQLDRIEDMLERLCSLMGC